MILAEGGGRNGKSTLLETLPAFLGCYSQKPLADTLSVRREGSVPNDLAQMHGARLVVAVETGDCKRLDKAR